MSVLTQLRAAATTALLDGGMRAAEYVAETIVPPIAVVVPAQPYLVWPAPGRDVPFGHVGVNLDVLLLTGRDASKQSAEDIDSMVVDAIRVLSAADYDITEVAQPGVVTLSGAKFLGSVLTIQQTIKEP